MYTQQAVLIWIGLLIINIATVVYLASWTGSGHVLYFSVVYTVVVSVGSFFYLSNRIRDTVFCKHCSEEIDRNWF